MDIRKMLDEMDIPYHTAETIAEEYYTRYKRGEWSGEYLPTGDMVSEEFEKDKRLSGISKEDIIASSETLAEAVDEENARLNNKFA